MDVTSRYVLDFATRHAAGQPCEILDFGCGAGGVVAAGRAAGLHMWGADVYYGGSETRRDAEAAGLLGSEVLEIRGGRLPFADASLDLVVNNQVMEHVEDLDRELGEIHRVLKPGGTALSLFPSRDVWREGHIGIPFAHRFPKGSRARLWWTWGLRSLGLGYWKEQAATGRQWAVDKLAWMDAYTRYRSRREIFRAYDRYFRNEAMEADYIRYRLRDRAWRAPAAELLRVPPVRAAGVALFRKLAFLVILSRKEAR
ncbi:MAG TPA: class I SAM-dependent methyltransferase [Bryobacteraceae bacterium]|nr:class I SAM-dependent methyltransferase [Bryobacteraceae bacterium]